VGGAPACPRPTPGLRPSHGRGRALPPAPACLPPRAAPTPPCDTLVTVGVALSRKGRCRLTRRSYIGALCPQTPHLGLRHSGATSTESVPPVKNRTPVTRVAVTSTSRRNRVVSTTRTITEADDDEDAQPAPSWESAQIPLPGAAWLDGHRCRGGTRREPQDAVGDRQWALGDQPS
jgi:hypothetical protein